MPTLDAYIHGAWTKITLPEVSTGPLPPGPGGPPEGPGGGNPPGIWGGGNEPFPTPPIVIPPDFIAPGYPAHPIVIPPLNPPSIWPGRPTHPIVIPPDLGIWPNPPEGTAPHPEHPIVIPPPTSIWPPVPTHPIVLPDPPVDGEPPKPPEALKNWDVVAYWTPEGGWAVAIVPNEGATVPTPSGGS